MDLTAVLVMAYGLFSLIGGAVGYFKAKSKASLVAGSLSGVVLLASAYGMTQGIRAAYYLSLGVALLLGTRFLKTWFKTRRLIPDLLMMSLSLATLISVSLKLLELSQ